MSAAGLRRSKISAIIDLTHPAPVLIFSFIAWSSAVFALRQVPSLSVSVSLVAAMACALATIGMLNEVFDRDIDSITKPWRAIPAGHINIAWVVILAIATSIVGVGIAALLSVASAALLMLCVGVGIAYSAKLKRTGLSWLPYVFGYPLVPVWAWVSVGKFEVRALVIFGIAAPFVVAVHLCNQLQDFEADATVGVGGVVHFLGKPRATILCYALLAVSPLPLVASVVFSGQFACIVIIVLASAVHWCLTIPSCLIHRTDFRPAVYGRMLQRLQFTGPLMLMSWLWTQSTAFG